MGGEEGMRGGGCAYDHNKEGRVRRYAGGQHGVAYDHDEEANVRRLQKLEEAIQDGLTRPSEREHFVDQDQDRACKAGVGGGGGRGVRVQRDLFSHGE